MPLLRAFIVVDLDEFFDESLAFALLAAGGGGGDPRGGLWKLAVSAVPVSRCGGGLRDVWLWRS